MAFVRALYCSDRKGNKDSRQEEAQWGPVLRTFEEAAFMEKQQQGSKATVFPVRMSLWGPRGVRESSEGPSVLGGGGGS